jgi:hypothetical protein
MIVIDHTYMRRPPFDASQTFAEIASICRQYNVTEVYSDRYSIGLVVSECARHNLTHRASDLDKSRIYLHCLPQLTSSRVRLPDVPEIVSEFCLLERRPGSDGRDKVDARGGRHEDLANVIAGCVWLLSGPQSSADGWIEYLRRELARGDTDVDGIRTAAGPAPDWSYRFASKPAPQPEKLITIEVPQLIASSGGMVVVRGTNYVPRFRERKAFIEMKRADALWLLTASEPWRTLNEVVSKELLKEDQAA